VAARASNISRKGQRGRPVTSPVRNAVLMRVKVSLFQIGIKLSPISSKFMKLHDLQEISNVSFFNSARIEGG
jgi:hypothetical protein